MTYIKRPEQNKIVEGHTSMDVFLKDVIRVIDKTKPYGMYVVLFDAENAHGYQFGLSEGDYDIVGMIANTHREGNYE